MQTAIYILHRMAIRIKCRDRLAHPIEIVPWRSTQMWNVQHTHNAANKEIIQEAGLN
jgi:hypothetical protein